MFLGTSNKVYILDKTENNPNLQVDGFPAWGSGALRSGAYMYGC
jgi:hypothetical protein